ncbi:MAG: TonB-dependent siderophore receptor [Methylophilaceae bacterium]|jgi:catecholate siderophore receptor|nr:TonB-dependent siderophore receptor [Methylophilaceae bacterium]
MNTVRSHQLKQSSHLMLRTFGLIIGASLITMPQSAIAEENITLDSVDVVGKKISDTKPLKGYNAKKSITATKTDAELRDVPQAITVITQDVIKDQSMQSIADTVRYVPGVTASLGEGNRDAVVFRGNQTTSDLFIDGMRDDVQIYRDLYNTDRIEVLKGPNGMIFGRGGAGGVMNRVTKKAGWDPVKDLSLTYGAWNQKRIAGDYSEGLSNEVAFRVNAVYEDADSYRNGVNLERFGITPTITIAPDENTTIYLTTEYFKDKRISDRGVPSLVNASGENRRPFNIGDEDQFFGNAALSPTESETTAFNAIIEHTFANKVKIRNNTRYANYNKFYQNIYANSPVSVAGTLTLSGYRDETDRVNIINQTDVTIPFSTGQLNHKFLVGAEIVKQDDKNSRLTMPNVAGISASNPTITGNFNTLARDQETDVSSRAFYVQDQIELSSKWQVVAGLRRDIFDTDYTNKTNPANVLTVKTTDAFWSPRAGLIFKPTNNTSLYTSYSLSYATRAGDQLTGFRGSENRPELFQPEKFINKEIGVKWDINPNLSFTAATYLLERENLIARDPNVGGATVLIDGQETKGVELSLAGNLTDKWSVIASYTYQDGEITKDQGAAGDISIQKGSELAETPDHSYALWNKYEINGTWAVALGVVGRSEMYAAIPQVGDSTVLQGYTRYDAAIFAKLSEKAQLQFNLENLTNKEYAISSHNNNNIMPGAPISGRVTLNYSF